MSNEGHTPEEGRYAPANGWKCRHRFSAREWAAMNIDERVSAERLFELNELRDENARLRKELEDVREAWNETGKLLAASRQLARELAEASVKDLESILSKYTASQTPDK